MASWTIYKVTSTITRFVHFVLLASLTLYLSFLNIPVLAENTDNLSFNTASQETWVSGNRHQSPLFQFHLALTSIAQHNDNNEQDESEEDDSTHDEGEQRSLFETLIVYPGSSSVATKAQTSLGLQTSSVPLFILHHSWKSYLA